MTNELYSIADALVKPKLCSLLDQELLPTKFLSKVTEEVCSWSCADMFDCSLARPYIWDEANYRSGYLSSCSFDTWIIEVFTCPQLNSSRL